MMLCHPLRSCLSMAYAMTPAVKADAIAVGTVSLLIPPVMSCALIANRARSNKKLVERKLGGESEESDHERWRKNDIPQPVPEKCADSSLSSPIHALWMLTPGAKTSTAGP